MTRPGALFVNPPLHLPADFVDYPWFADHGVLLAAARVARAGWDVAVADAFALPSSGRAPDGDGWLLGAPEADLLASLPDRPFDAVVVGASPFLRPWDPDPRTAALVASLRARFPGAALVLADADPGGMHAVDADGAAALARLPGLDAVLKFAGESWFDDPARLAALRGTGAVIRDPAAPWSAPPPFPLWEALDRRAWGAFLWRCFGDGRWANPFGIDATTRPFLTSSGCPHRCVFCSSNPGWRDAGRKVQRVVPLPVLEDWALLARAQGARRLFVLDEMANLRPDFEDVLKVFERLDLKVEFPNGLRADRLADTAIARLAGRISLLSLSAESASADDLQGPIGKRQDPAEVRRAVATAARHGIPTLVHFVIGFPWETPRHVLDTLDLAWSLFEEHGATPAVQFATPLRGTPLFDACVEQGLLPADGGFSSDGSLFQHRPAFRPPALPEGFLETAFAAFRRKVEASNTRKVIVNITYECINACEFCAVSNRVRRPIPWPRLQEILREHRAAGVTHLDLDGGEPTLHPNLLDALRLARELGYREVNVTSNGRRLADRQAAADLLATGVGSVLVSLHGADADVHDAVTGAPGAFDETLAGLRNLVALRPAGVDLGVNVTVCRRNVDVLEDLVALVQREGVDKVNLQLVTPFGAARAGVVPPVEESVAAVTRVLDRFGDTMRLHVVNAQFCFFPGRERFLSGDVGKVGRNMVFVTEETVNLFQYLAARRVRREPCATCAFAPVCDGFYTFEEGASDA